MNGSGLALVFKARIVASGQLLTITRKSQADNTYSTRTAYFLPQPLNTQGGGNLNIEGGLNAGEDNPYDFVTAGDTDCTENDRITYNGFQWRVANTNPQVLSGTQVSLHCYAFREGVSS